MLSSACDLEGTALTLRTLLFALRDMPYERPEGGSNDARACVSQWRGTCSAKHLAAYELLEALGLSPRLWLASYRIDFAKPYYSDQLRSKAQGLVVHDIHNYITCAINGRSTIVDITFPAALGGQGFPVTTSWSEGQDFVLCCTPEEVREIRNIDESDHTKRQWLQTLNPGATAMVREAAIRELIISAQEADRLS
ncbi:MAG: hypothetical protein WBA83_15350 [Burkholderiaceae bacterium]